MTNYGLTQSTIKPQITHIDKYSVWVARDIKEIQKEGEIFYKYILIQYTKDEYLMLLDEQLTQTQLALTNLFERMI